MGRMGGAVWDAAVMFNPPLREAKGTRAKHAGDARTPSQQHPLTQQPSPLPLGGRGLG